MWTALVVLLVLERLEKDGLVTTLVSVWLLASWWTVPLLLPLAGLLATWVKPQRDGHQRQVDGQPS